MGNAVFIVWRETIEAMLADRCSASPPAIAASAPPASPSHCGRPCSPIIDFRNTNYYHY